MPLVGIVLALASAAWWGGGDYAGGRATRRLDSFAVLGLSASAGVVMLAGLAVVAGEALPGSRALLFAVAAGLCGALGITALYRGLATGSAAVVAPVAAVVTAAIPVIFAGVTEGLPTPLQGSGFIAALIGIWLVAAADRAAQGTRSDITLAVAAGVGFGLFLVLIASASAGSFFAPLAVARATTLALAAGVSATRGVRWPSPFRHPVAILAGLLDAGGNVLYVAAGQQIRLDVAAVLSSLYPVTTVLLARAIDGDAVTRLQWLGTAVCLGSIVLITL